MPIEEQDTLVAALKEGRTGAFEQLYAALHPRIYNLAARVVGDTDDAADITQEVFIKAYTRIPAHQGELRLEPWLYRVAVNTCYDHLRRRNVRSATPLDEIGEIADARDELERSQTSSAVSSALQKINPRYRTALVLKDLHGFGNAEVAAALGVSQGATNVLLFRARGAFKRAFRGTAPAGSGGLSALGLAFYLPNLPVPQALQTAPDFSALAPLAAALAPAAAPLADMATPLAHTAAPLATSALPAAEAGAGLAASVGVLAKIGGAVGAKVAVGVLGVTTLAGGSLAVHQAQTRGTTHGPATTTAIAAVPATDATSPATGLGATAELQRHRYLHARKGAGNQGEDKKEAAHGGGSGGGKNGQGTGQAGSGTGQQNGGGGSGAGNGAVGASAGNGQGAGPGQKATAGAGTAAGSRKADAPGNDAGNAAPAGNGAGSDAATPVDGTGGGGSGEAPEGSGVSAP